MERKHLIEEDNEDMRRQELNKTAEIVVKRISDKLRGMEFHSSKMGKMDIEHQVDNLIKQATSHETLSYTTDGLFVAKILKTFAKDSLPFPAIARNAAPVI